jgi:hypothetical protein
VTGCQGRAGGENAGRRRGIDRKVSRVCAGESIVTQHKRSVAGIGHCDYSGGAGGALQLCQECHDTLRGEFAENLIRCR